MMTCRRRVRLSAPVCVQQNILTISRHKGAYMVEGGRVRAGCGDFHLERGDERVMGGAASSLSLPPVLTQAASQQEVFPRGFIFTCKTQQGVLCRDTTEANSALDTHYGVELKKISHIHTRCSAHSHTMCLNHKMLHHFSKLTCRLTDSSHFPYKL